MDKPLENVPVTPECLCYSENRYLQGTCCKSTHVSENIQPDFCGRGITKNYPAMFEHWKYGLLS